MAGSKENNPGVIGPANIQRGIIGGGGKFVMGQNRRALGDINQNVVGALPCAVHKRGLSDNKPGSFNKVFCQTMHADNAQNPSNPVNRRITRKLASQMGNKQEQMLPEDLEKPVQLVSNAKESEDCFIRDVENFKANEDIPVPMFDFGCMFRKLACQMGNKQEQMLPEDLEKPVQLVSNAKESEDCFIRDVENFKANEDIPVPMFVQHTKSLLEEIDLMEEVEMEDIAVEPIEDIDSPDKKNPLAVVEYIDDLYIYYKKVENYSCVPPNYMAMQPDINEKMRGILIDWLIEVHYKFELMDETLYLIVNLIDRFLAVRPVMRKKLQLVGVTAMLLASKYEEVSVPVVEDLILISDKAYSRQDVLDMEKLMVNTLQFNVSVPTAYVFMRRFLKAAYSDKKLELLSFFMIELCLVEYEMLNFCPSLLAAAAIYTAQCTLGGSKHWSKTCEQHSGYLQEQLLECSRLMVTFHQKAGTGKLTGVHRKYSTSKFGCAAKIEPANFLLEE